MNAKDFANFLSGMLMVGILWAYFFGFTWNGVHHSLTCGCSNGVEVK